MFCLWYAIFVDGTIRPASTALAPSTESGNDRWTPLLTGVRS
jgi:hypothetical protein